MAHSPRRWFVRLILVSALFLLSVEVWQRRRLIFDAWTFRHEPFEMTMPVEGVDVGRISSTFGAPRSGGRRHKGADIFAPQGTPVVSATRGVCQRIGWDSLGGKVVWVVGEGPAAYYYAHLDDWAPDLEVGDRIDSGQLLGYVGNTGNAHTTPPHLHFGIYRLHFFGHKAVDPVPILKSKVLALRKRALSSPLRNLFAAPS
jgi:murein DD-endopeptidase MepM/ murein hydrolase activator NlpD